MGKRAGMCLLCGIILCDIVLLGVFLRVCDWSAERFFLQREIQADYADAKPETEKLVALTFDDGPHSVYTPILLDALKERDVVATFFLIGRNIEGNEKIIQRMAQEGHLIGNHTYDHVQLTSVSAEEANRQVCQTNVLVEMLTGIPVYYIRPPYGSWNDKISCAAFMTITLWDVDPKDWRDQNAEVVAQRIIRSVESGDIILLHDVYKTSVEAAILVVDELKKQGYRFVTVNELVVD